MAQGEEGLRVDGIAMVKDAPRSLGNGAAPSGPPGGFQERLVRPLVGGDEPQGFFAGKDQLNAADNDALKRIAAARR